MLQNDLESVKINCSDIAAAMIDHIMSNTNIGVINTTNDTVRLFDGTRQLWIQINCATGNVELLGTLYRVYYKYFDISDPAQSRQALEELNDYLGINQ